MGKYDDLEGIAKRSMVLFFVLDVSGSMAGSKIGSVISGMKEAIPEVKEIANDSADANIKIAILTFSDSANWLYDYTYDINTFEWNKDLEAGGLTEFGAACKALNEKLSRDDGFMSDINGSYAPAIILMSDGEPTDDYKKALTELKLNSWFKAAVKVALAVEGADKDVLAEFTGSPESVISVEDKNLKKVIRFVSVTASKVGSRSSNASDGDVIHTKQDDLNAQITEFKEELIADESYDNW